MSTERQSTRDWPDVWLTPWKDNLTLPYDGASATDVDLQGVPRQGVHLAATGGKNAWKVATISNYQETQLDTVWWVDMDSGIAAGTNQAAVRQTFKLTITPGRIRFERLPSATATGIVWVDANAPVQLASDYVVQFAHHSYNPAKDGAGVPATWHWDEMKLNPAAQFGIIKTHTRALLQNGSVVFNASAPANSWLRFSAIGSVQYSLNGGTTYQTAPKQAFLGRNGHASSYFVSIPAGTQTVQFRFSADGWYQGPFVAQDFAIWSTSGGTSTAPPTVPSPTKTPTPLISTRTPTPSGPSPTATPGGTVNWATSASVTKATINRGESQGVTVSVVASQNGTALVDAEVYDASGAKVWQSYQDNVSLTAGTARNITVSWSIPSSLSTGTYTVKVGVFSPAWGQLLSWNNDAARFSVR